MRPYELGNPDLDKRLQELVRDAVADPKHEEQNGHDEDIIAELLVSGLKMLRDDTERGDLKLANSALKEMRYSFLIFSRYRHIPKVTIFGSARTAPSDPNYMLAADFAKQMVDDRGWMVVTGAGPGIMEAGNLGAGEDFGFGVNIRLPFEAKANEYVHESKLINFKYFFTRKLIFMKESNAFALFPGGFGTQDETFELLTLIQTGKSALAPIVLIDAPGTDYWSEWIEFTRHLNNQGMISPDDLHLFKHVATAEEAADEVCEFYANYDSMRYVDGKLILRHRHAITQELMHDLNDEFSDIVVSGTIATTEPTEIERRDDDKLDLARIKFHFDRRHFGRLRLLVDRLNAASPGEGTTAAS